MNQVRPKGCCVGSLMLVPLFLWADPIPTGAIDPATPSGGANAAARGASIEGKSAEAATPPAAAAGSSSSASNQSHMGASSGSGSSRPDSRGTAETDQSATSPSASQVSASKPAQPVNVEGKERLPAAQDAEAGKQTPPKDSVRH
jgi:hypothetical protein